MKRSALALLTLGLTLAPHTAHAASEGGGTADMFWQGVNLLILIGVLVLVARKPIQAFFRDRRATVRDDLDSASQLLEDAQGRLEEWEGKVSQLDQELAQVRQTAEERAEAERARILEEAEASAQRIREDARAAVQQELHRARGALREEAAALAVELAERMLSEQVGDADRDRLVDEFVGRIENTAARGGNGS